MPRTKNWCFTYYSGNDLIKLDPELYKEPGCAPPWTPDLSKVGYCQYQLEKCPKTGRLHLQGYMVMRGYFREGTVMKCLPHVTTWHNAMLGSGIDNEIYTEKSRSKICGPWFFGEPSLALDLETDHIGKKRACDELYELAQGGKTEKEIYEARHSLMLNPHAVKNAIEVLSPIPDSRPVSVYIVFGPPHCGKTERCQAAFPNHFLVCGKPTPSSFKRYRGQPCVIVDAFKSMEWEMTFVEQLIKPPVLPLDVKYGQVFTLWTTFIITTNQHPDSMYRRAEDEINRDSLFMRVKKIIITQSDDYEPFSFE